MSSCPKLFRAAGLLPAILIVSIAGAVTTAQQSPASSSNSNGGVDQNPDDPDRQQAMQLFEQHKLPAAAELLLKVVARYPKDVVAHERLGVALLSRADTLSDPAKKKADRVRARAELLRAQELGDKSDLCRVLLAEIPEDGSQLAFSDRTEVNAAMSRGEAAFASGQWERALKEYSQAFELDPRLYIAAVDLGDTYFRLKRMDKAGEWFAIAIQIDPNQEVAYRYWGDALLAEDKMKEAREKFIDAVVASPYAQSSWAGLHNWVARNNVRLNEIAIALPPAPTVGSDGRVNITVDASRVAKKNDDLAQAAWLAYSMERALWRGEKFRQEFPKEERYRHSLKEEAEALSKAVAVFEELQRKKKAGNPGSSMELQSQLKEEGRFENPNDPLLLLSRLKADGLIEAYVLLIKGDSEVSRDYTDYRAAYRDKLLQFMDKYLVPPAP
jgi:tetratricopeptide (TPR) repeat protein